eukprot:bmy_04600T0
MTSARKAEATRPRPLNKAFRRRATERSGLDGSVCFARVQVAVRGGGAADHELGGEGCFVAETRRGGRASFLVPSSALPPQPLTGQKRGRWIKWEQINTFKTVRNEYGANMREFPILVMGQPQGAICQIFLLRIGENLNASASSVDTEPAVSSATQAKEKVKTTVGMVLLPKPRVPYPRFSRFSQREQRNYVDLLVKYAKIPASSKAVGINKNDYLQYLDMKKHVNEEVTEFLKFLQNSAKKCAQDYNMLSDNARLFTE